MNKLSRDAWLAIFLFSALSVVLFVTIARQQRPTQPPLSTFSSEEAGGRALWLWLQAEGFRTTNAVAEHYAIPTASNVVVILEPTDFIEPSAWQVLDPWVAQGGTLLIAGDSYLFTSWASHFQLRRTSWQQALVTTTLRLQNPLLLSPPMPQPPAFVPTTGGLRGERSDYVVHAAAPEGPVILSLAQGKGRVVLSTTAYPFSNRGLQERGNPELVLNLLSIGGAAGQVWFDEWHHGARGGAASRPPTGIGDWLRSTVAGRSLLLGLAIIFLTLLLQGRNFGQPMPLPRQTMRRTPLEYVTAMANLNRRAGHRTALLQDYHRRLKRALGWRYRLDVQLPDADFVTQLAAYNPELDSPALQRLLQQLRRTDVSEAELVQLSAAAAALIN